MQKAEKREHVWDKTYATVHNMIYAAGCILMVIASFMPYVHTDEKNMTLMEGNDGIFFLMLAVLIAIFIVYGKEKVVGVLSVVLLYLGAYELAHTYGIMSKTGKAVTLRMGYYVLAVGTAVILVGAAYFIYRHGLKDFVTRLYDRFFPLKRKEA